MDSSTENFAFPKRVPIIWH